MTGATQDTPEPDVMELFDDISAGLACRVCGALVAPDYVRAHWDWHEAANGA